MAKYLITTIQENLCCVHVSAAPNLLELKILAISRHFWPLPWISHLFYNSFIDAAHFIIAGPFWIN